MELTQEQLRHLIHEQVREELHRMAGTKLSSTEISTTSAGKPSFNIKVYGPSPTTNTNIARQLYANMRRDVFGEEYQEPTPYQPPPGDDEIAATFDGQDAPDAEGYEAPGDYPPEESFD